MTADESDDCWRAVPLVAVEKVVGDGTPVRLKVPLALRVLSVLDARTVDDREPESGSSPSVVASAAPDDVAEETPSLAVEVDSESGGGMGPNEYPPYEGISIDERVLVDEVGTGTGTADTDDSGERLVVMLAVPGPNEVDEVPVPGSGRSPEVNKSADEMELLELSGESVGRSDKGKELDGAT